MPKNMKIFTNYVFLSNLILKIKKVCFEKNTAFFVLIPLKKQYI
jgi:hypothetical protein